MHRRRYPPSSPCTSNCKDTCTECLLRYLNDSVGISGDMGSIECISCSMPMMQDSVRKAVSKKEFEKYVALPPFPLEQGKTVYSILLLTLHSSQAIRGSRTPANTIRSQLPPVPIPQLHAWANSHPGLHRPNGDLHVMFLPLLLQSPHRLAHRVYMHSIR